VAEYKPSVNDAANCNWNTWVQFRLSFGAPKIGKKADGSEYHMWGATFTGPSALDCGEKGALAPGDMCTWFQEFDTLDAWSRAAPAKGAQVAVRINKPNAGSKKAWELVFADAAQQARAATAPAPATPQFVPPTAGAEPTFQPLPSTAPAPAAAPDARPVFVARPAPDRPTIDDLAHVLLGCLAAAKWAFAGNDLEPAVEDVRSAGVAIFIAALSERTVLPVSDCPAADDEPGPTLDPTVAADDDLPF